MNRWLFLCVAMFAMIGMAADCDVSPGDDDVDPTSFDVELYAYTEPEETAANTYEIWNTGQCGFTIGSIELAADASGLYACPDLGDGATVELDFRSCLVWHTADAPVTLDCTDERGGDVNTGAIDLGRGVFTFTGQSVDGVSWKLMGWL